jgi:hypothetical protein
MQSVLEAAASHLNSQKGAEGFLEHVESCHSLDQGCGSLDSGRQKGSDIVG